MTYRPPSSSSGSLARRRVEDKGRQIVAFKRAVKQQPDEGFVLAMEFEHLEGQRAKEGAVIFAAGGFGELRGQALARLLAFEAENGGVEVVSGGEVAKDDGFADACTRGDLFGCRAAKAFLRKQLGGNQDNLIAPLFGRHASSRGSFRTC